MDALHTPQEQREEKGDDEREVTLEVDELSDAEDRNGKPAKKKSAAFYRNRLIEAFDDPLILAVEWTGPGACLKHNTCFPTAPHRNLWHLLVLPVAGTHNIFPGR